MKVLEKVSGNRAEMVPDLAFKLMALMFAIRDKIVKVDKLLDEFGICPGQVIVDYGCGPGSYIKRASELVGSQGRVYAVDIHALAIEAVKKRIRKENLINVTGVLAQGEHRMLDDNCADIIYALDMFHMVKEPGTFLHELRRILKSSGVLFISDGHQKRVHAKAKINASEAWMIVDENFHYMKCIPLK
ncbi:MAG: methyltransferase domain-containing protein [Deltaproteobacteria bacterium]|nr:methyltransferase domain-containing protein [Deltaproteobacteria bacterium]